MASTPRTQDPEHQQPSRTAQAGVASGRRDPPLDSVEILRGQSTVEISHNGVLYRLQSTRLGKLILTK